MSENYLKVQLSFSKFQIHQPIKLKFAHFQMYHCQKTQIEKSTPVNTRVLKLDDLKPQYIFYGQIVGTNEIDLIANLDGKIKKVSKKFFNFKFVFQNNILSRSALFKKKVFVYLISSGYEEWKFILGSWSIWIYHIMYSIVTSNSTVIALHERLYKKKGYVITSSALDEKWLHNLKEARLDKIRFLYVARVNPEKGIYEFLEMFKDLKLKYFRRL